jgi:hypothetical protein
MEVVVIGQNGNINDKKYDKDAINRFTKNPRFVTKSIAFIAEDDCYIYRISHSPENSEKNIHATNLVSNENFPIYGETMIIKISKDAEIQHINFDYLMAHLIDGMNITGKKEAENKTPHGSNIHAYTDYYDHYYDHYYDYYYDDIEEHFGGYDPY